MATALAGVAAKLEQLPAEIIRAATDRFEEIAKEAAGKVVGGGGVMRMHARGGRIAVKMGTVAEISGDSAVIRGTPTAQWTWIETGTKPHRVGRRRSFLSAPGYSHPVRGPVRHPGSTGRRAWTSAVTTFRSEFAELAIDELRKAVG